MLLKPEDVSVFISYSHETMLHNSLVQLMAKWLKEEEGFKVFLDALHETPPTDWSEEIERKLSEADAVLCVCTPTYETRAAGEVPGGAGRGVAQEASMMRAEAFDHKMRPDRFHVVQLDGSALSVSVFLGGKGKQVFRWPTAWQELSDTLKVPTLRRRILDALREVFGRDVDALSEWARSRVPLSRDKVLVFDGRARRVANRLMTHNDGEVTKRALEDLVRRSASLAESLGIVAEKLNLGELEIAAVKPNERPPKPETVTGPLTLGELASYRTAVRRTYGINYFLGFNRPFEYGVAWEELHVELEMAKDYDAATRDDFVRRKEGKKTVTLDKAFGYAKRCRKLAMTLLGHPGSGKTTQLRQVVLRVLDEARGAGSLGLDEGTVPVFVPLHRLGALLPTQEELPTLKALALATLPGACGISETLAARLLAQPRVLYLLDGLDEIADANQRARMVEVIANALDRIGEDSLFVSCRYSGAEQLRALCDNRFLELHLQPLDDEQVERLVHTWHGAVEVMQAQDDEREPSSDQARTRAKALLQQLRAPAFTGHKELTEIAQTPLLLTALCLIHRERGSQGLPADKAEIYGACEEILLEHWVNHRKGRTRSLHGGQAVVDGVDAKRGRRVLQRVAFWLHREEGRRHARVAELCAPVERGLADVERSDLEAERFVRSFASETGLLTPYGPQTRGFIHLGFQEHLAALHVRERWESEPGVLADFVSHEGRGWWREVSRMALSGASVAMRRAFVRRVLAGPELAAWSRTQMLTGCLRESAKECVGPLEAVLRESVTADGHERQLDALRLLVQGVLPYVPSEESRLDAWLREHPVADVRRRWQTRAKRAVPGAPKVIGKAGVELMPIPGGWFSMGTAYDDDTAWDDEQPQHEVELEPFYLARTPVTNAQYRRFWEDSKQRAKEPEFWGDRRYNRDEQPVVGVSWDEAKAYCEWAGLSLPTEAQWEYACRAGTTTRYHSGDDEADLAKVGWYDGNSQGKLQNVGQLQPNAWGLYDMHGNAFEWCEDNEVDNYKEAVHQAGDGLRTQPVGDADRVIRGGSFDSGGRFARSAFRDFWPPGIRYDYVGFRPAQGIHF